MSDKIEKLISALSESCANPPKQYGLYIVNALLCAVCVFLLFDNHKLQQQVAQVQLKLQETMRTLAGVKSEQDKRTFYVYQRNKENHL